MLADVLHFAFTVSNLERSVRWYTDVLGLELVHRQRGDSDYIRTLVGVPDAVIEVAMLKLPGVDPKYSTHMLELVEYLQPEGGVVELANTNVGVAHLAFIVDDIHDRHRALVAQNVEFVNPPVAITEGANAGGFTCYFKDPDGITLELLQPSERRMRAIGLRIST
jgi:catechol 2,3-dioxygenase-like lactoylglutathione lyase family enzyme